MVVVVVVGGRVGEGGLDQRGPGHGCFTTLPRKYQRAHVKRLSSFAFSSSTRTVVCSKSYAFIRSFLLCPLLICWTMTPSLLTLATARRNSQVTFPRRLRAFASRLI